MVYRVPQEPGPVQAALDGERGIGLRNTVSEPQVEVNFRNPCSADYRSSLVLCNNHWEENDSLVFWKNNADWVDSIYTAVVRNLLNLFFHPKRLSIVLCSLDLTP